MSNRSDIRWAPFDSLLQSKSLLHELSEKRKIISKPTLSLDELEVLEKDILMAFHTKSVIEIEYFYEGKIYKKQGILSSICKNSFKVYFRDSTSLYFDQILKVHFL